ncbi:acyl-CoA N-acyltransferase [Xylaria sp. FL1042]|nr:acyl-CoA N-acyltransferase [Xylaria sp. FL1042]
MATVDTSTSNAILVPIVPPQDLVKPIPLDITVGYALASEAAAIAKIGADTFTATFGSSIPAKDLAIFLAATYSEVTVLAELQDPSVQTWAARDGASGKVLGLVQLVRGLSEPCVPGDAAMHAELRHLYVDTAAHGRGIGSKLIDAVEQQARIEGFKQLWLTVWEQNSSAERLYQRLGYQRCGTIEFMTGEFPATDNVLAKSL